MRAKGRLSILLLLFMLPNLGCQKVAEPVEAKLWSSNVDQALKRAVQESKPVLIDFGADWCKPCKRMHAEVFVDPTIDKRLRTEFIPVMIDATEMTPPIYKLVKEYRVGTLPTIIFLDPQGKFLSDQSLVGFTNLEKLHERFSEVTKLVAKR